MSPTAFAILLFLTLLQGFTRSAQSSAKGHAGSRRLRRSYSDYMEQNGGTPMDTIIAVNDYQGVRAVDGVSIREGDIAVSRRSERSCFARSCLWTKSVDGHVYIAYTLSPLYSEEDERKIKRGMELIERGTCVRFVPRTHQRDHLDIQPRSGCWSYLGANGGRQVLSLQTPDCVSSTVVSHQLMHAMGFLHEQSRSDRDKYVTVLWSNIWKDRSRNFAKFRANNLDMPYDYNSIMHFGKYAYSEDGNPTIVQKRNWSGKLGQALGPSELDIMKINQLYQCN
ncbi:hatching enzyme 1.2 [Salminus brasiliensis]|uniref:hatching enzyme 1.2 n=1 Tax=Salminus brasiliensis TaxID=930266 RepID=UPI003B8316BC